mmetsp:Transcript_10589/g.65177  ORF Transcript_10589/g.65177 Transcript_10589/m.65177 type:complete len:274 (-) Transcript_10589:9428-10249(-)
MLPYPSTPKTRAKGRRQEKHRRSRQKARGGRQAHPMPRLQRAGPQNERTQLLPAARTCQEKDPRKTARTQAKGREQETRKETRPDPRRRRILPRKTLHPSHDGPTRRERKGACRFRAGETHQTGRTGRPLIRKPIPELRSGTGTVPRVPARPTAAPNNAMASNRDPRRPAANRRAPFPPPARGSVRVLEHKKGLMFRTGICCKLLRLFATYASRIAMHQPVDPAHPDGSLQCISPWMPSSKENCPGCTRYLSSTDGDQESSPPRPIILWSMHA